jgi:hypothetical protein
MSALGLRITGRLVLGFAALATRPQRAPARQRVAANGGPVARTQGSLAVAVNVEQDWKEF